jgi:hypothetical protein
MPDTVVQATQATPPTAQVDAGHLIGMVLGGNPLFGLLAGHILTPYMHILGENQIFIAGLALLATFFFIDLMRNNISRLTDAVRSRLYVSISINESEDAYKMLSEYLMDIIQTPTVSDSDSHPIKRKGNLRQLVGKSIESDPYQDPYYDSRFDSQEERRPRLVFVPEKGSYSFDFQGKTIYAVFSTHTEEGGKKTKQSIVLRTYSPSSDTTILKQLVQQALSTQYKKEQNKTSLFQAYYDRWRRTTARAPRSLESVVLKDGMVEELLADIEAFRSSKEWYAEAGVPWRRGYLLYGPPGTGKSSTILALAGKLNMSVCLLSLSNGSLTDTTLQELMTTAPSGSFILLEDIDAAFPKVDKKEKSLVGTDAASTSSVTLSGLLNCLDGIVAQEGGIVFLTTNHPEKLPPALLRPGRCDKRFLFDKADQDQIRRMFIKFFGRSSADEVSRHFPSNVLTTAQIQGFFMNYRSHTGSRQELVSLMRAAIPGWLKELEVEAARFGWNNDDKTEEKSEEKLDEIEDAKVESDEETAASRTTTPTRNKKKNRKRNKDRSAKLTALAALE